MSETNVKTLFFTKDQVKAIVERLSPNIQFYRTKETFGRGGIPSGKDFFNLTELEQTFVLLWQNGCRVPLDSIIQNELPWMRGRAAETNFFFSVIRNRAKKLNPALYEELSEPQKRRPGEPMPEGEYEPGTGPDDNDIYIYPLQGIFGYGSARILPEIIGRREKGTTPSLFANAIELLDPVIEKSTTRSEFVARLAGKGFENGAGAIAMLSHLFPNEILTEQNCFQDYRDLVNDLSIYAPTVWSAYQDAAPKLLTDNGIAPMNRFISSG